jgi:hypothetical protein
MVNGSGETVAAKTESDGVPRGDEIEVDAKTHQDGDARRRILFASTSRSPTDIPPPTHHRSQRSTIARIGDWKDWPAATRSFSAAANSLLR